MVPAKRSFVDFGEREAAALVWVLDMGEVVVEVVKGVVAARRQPDGALGRHGSGCCELWLISIL